MFQFSVFHLVESQFSFLYSSCIYFENSMAADKLRWFPVGTLPKDGEIKKIHIEGRTMCIIDQGGQVYATGARCPHAGADLSRGWCERGKLVCPVHRHQFDLVSGKGDLGQGNFIPVFPIQIIQGKPCVGIKTSWWKQLFS